MKKLFAKTRKLQIKRKFLLISSICLVFIVFIFYSNCDHSQLSGFVFNQITTPLENNETLKELNDPANDDTSKENLKFFGNKNLIGLAYHSTSDELTDVFLPKYHETGVRVLVKSQLKFLANQGVNLIGTRIWHWNYKGKKLKPWVSEFPLSSQELENLRNYISDVRDTVSDFDGHHLKLYIYSLGGVFGEAGAPGRGGYSSRIESITVKGRNVIAELKTAFPADWIGSHEKIKIVGSLGSIGSSLDVTKGNITPNNVALPAHLNRIHEADVHDVQIMSAKQIKFINIDGTTLSGSFIKCEPPKNSSDDPDKCKPVLINGLSWWNLPPSEVIATSQQTYRAIIDLIKDIKFSDGRPVVRKYYLHGEMMIANGNDPMRIFWNTSSSRWMFKDSGLYSDFVNYAQKNYIHPAIYFFDHPRYLSDQSSDDYIDPLYPELNGHKNMIFTYRSFKFLKDNKLFIPPEVEGSYYAKTPEKVIKLMNDFKQSLPTLINKASIKIGISETISGETTEDRKKLFKTYNDIMNPSSPLHRPYFDGLAIWSSAKDPGKEREYPPKDLVDLLVRPTIEQASMVCKANLNCKFEILGKAYSDNAKVYLYDENKKVILVLDPLTSKALSILHNKINFSLAKEANQQSPLIPSYVRVFQYSKENYSNLYKIIEQKPIIYKAGSFRAQEDQVTVFRSDGVFSYCSYPSWELFIKYSEKKYEDLDIYPIRPKDMDFVGHCNF